MGAIYGQGGHPEISLKILQTVIEADKGNARAYYNLAVALEKLGKPDKAEEAYAKAAGLGYRRF